MHPFTAARNKTPFQGGGGGGVRMFLAEGKIIFPKSTREGKLTERKMHLKMNACKK